MLASRFFVLTIIYIQAFSADAGGLRGPPQPEVNTDTVETSLLARLSGMFRGGEATEHISSLEAALLPMYGAVPKEQDGTLSHPVVRYMLHRFFTQKHGWFIRGLEPSSANHDNSGNQTLQSLQEWVPSYLQNFLEELQGGRGISLRELAVMAATFEDLIHKEAVTRLEMTYKALELPEGSLLDAGKMRQALEVYLMIYMLGGNFTVRGTKAVHHAHAIFTQKVKNWTDVQDWMHKIQVELFPTSSSNALSFTNATRVVEEVGRRYGTYNDQECSELKEQLLEIEATKAGRVRLAEFYKKGLSGVFEFNEKIEYLRDLGVLDESDPEQPHVIVPNYVASRPNCLKASNFYVVCCRNECEDLLSSLEKRFKSETAKADEILDHVVHMSSGTVKAPRKLTDHLTQRLYSIAQANQGVVPMHGRLFAQWMHHAFPRECPYPQQAGTTSPQTPDEWMQATGQEDSKKTVEELQAHVDNDGACTLPKGAEARQQHHLKENELPWDEAEELLRPMGSMEKIQVRRSKSGFWKLASFASFVACLALMARKLIASSKDGYAKFSMLPHAQSSSNHVFF